MSNFKIEFVASIFTEGDTAQLRITWDAPVSAETELKWEILFKGFLPTNSDDYDVLTGTVIVPQGAPGEMLVNIPITDDEIAEQTKEIVVRLSEGDGNTNTNTNTTTQDTIEPSEASAVLKDDDPFPQASPYILGGGSNNNVLTLGSTAASSVQGAAGEDTYIVTRYQSADVSISDAGVNTLKLDNGVEVAGWVVGRNTGLLTLASGGKVRVPVVSDWKFQIGDGEILTLAEFEAAIGVSGDPFVSYIVETNLPAEVGEGHDGRSLIVGTAGQDVFTVGHDGDSTLEGLVGLDTYIITRFQSADVRIFDAGLNTLKLDVGLEVDEWVVNRNSGQLILASGGVVRVPSVSRWQFQIGDGEILTLAEFEAAIGVPADPNDPFTTFTVPFPDSEPPVAPSNNIPTLTGNNLDAIFVKGVAGTVDLSGSFTDADAGDILTFSSSNLPTGFTLDFATGVLSSTPETVGLFEDIVVTASDGKSGGTVDYTFDISVSIAEDPTYFKIEFVASIFTEGDTAQLRITWDAPVSAETELKWEILFKGFLPTNSDDYDVLTGTVIVPQGAPGEMLVNIPITDDEIAEQTKEIVVRLSEGDGNTNTNTTTQDTIEPSEASAVLKDDDPFPQASPYILGGGSNNNVLTLGSTAASSVQGAAGEDTYIVTRYQSADVSIAEFGVNTLKLDNGVEVAGWVVGRNTGLLTLASGGKVRVPVVSDWKFQIGDGEILTLAEFEAAIGVSGDPFVSYIVETNLPAEVGEGHDGRSLIVGTAGQDVFTVGHDGDSTLEGLVGLDTYIITRFQSADVRIFDAGLNTLKLDVGLEVDEWVVNRNSGQLILASGGVVRVPSVSRWQFQIGDGEILTLAEFEAAIGVPADPNDPFTTFTVPFPDSEPPVAPSNNIPTLTGNNLDAIFVKGVAGTVDLSGSFTDADAGDILTFSSSNLPTGFTLDFATGVLSSTPETVGLFEDIVVTASDGKSGGTVDYTFDISVSIAEDPMYYFAWSPTGTIVGGVAIKKGSLHRYNVSDDTFSATLNETNGILSGDNVVRLGSTFTDDADGETIFLSEGSDLYRVETGFNADVIINDISRIDGASNVIQFLSDVTIKGYEVVEVSIIPGDESATLRSLYLQIDTDATATENLVLLEIKTPKTQFYQVGAATETLLTYDDFLATLSEIDIPNVGFDV